MVQKLAPNCSEAHRHCIVAWFHFRIFSVIGQQRNSLPRCWQDNLHCTDVDVAAAWSQHSCASSTWRKYCSGFWDPSEIRGGCFKGWTALLALAVSWHTQCSKVRKRWALSLEHCATGPASPDQKCHEETWTPWAGCIARVCQNFCFSNCESTDSKFGSPSIKETFLPHHFYEKSQEK